MNATMESRRDRRAHVLEDEEERFDSSYWRIVGANGIRFADTVIRRLAFRFPELVRGRPDLESLRTDVQRTLVHLAAYPRRGGNDPVLAEFARRRATSGTLEEYLSAFLRAVIASVAECDPHHDTNVARAWIRTLRPGLSYMRRIGQWRTGL
jgi:hypothetical protein